MQEVDRNIHISESSAIGTEVVEYDLGKFSEILLIDMVVEKY